MLDHIGFHIFSLSTFSFFDFSLGQFLCDRWGLVLMVSTYCNIISPGLYTAYIAFCLLLKIQKRGIECFSNLIAHLEQCALYLCQCVILTHSQLLFRSLCFCTSVRPREIFTHKRDADVLKM